MPKRKASDSSSDAEPEKRVRIAAPEDAPNGGTSGAPSGKKCSSRPSAPIAANARAGPSSMKAKRKADATEGERSNQTKTDGPPRPPPAAAAPMSSSSSPAPIPDAPQNPSSKNAKGKQKAADPAASAPTAPANGPEKPKFRVRKLAPPRPFPTVPTSVSATGPRSAHTEGKNFICVTRNTPLGAYLRRCHAVLVKDGSVSFSPPRLPRTISSVYP